jgi:hypothetical protein
VSLFRSSLRPPAVLSDEAVERYLAAIRAEVDPDPAFRRRLRGVVLNQYVATREATRAGLVPRTMGRLGRAVLYASFALGVSVTGVMAGAEAAVPGDLLYPLKRAIEEMRVDVLPHEFHDALAIHELNERLSEVVTLVERGDTARVEVLVGEVIADAAWLTSGSIADGQLDLRNEVLAGLIARLPQEARIAIDRVVNEPGSFGAPIAPGSDVGTPSHEARPTPAPTTGAAGGQGNGNAGAGASGNAGGGNSSGGAGGGSDADHAGGSDNGNGGSGNSGGSREPSDTPESGSPDEPSPTAKPKKDPKP